MLGKRLLTWTAASLLVAGCGGGTAQVRASGSAGAQTESASGRVAAGATAQRSGREHEGRPGHEHGNQGDAAKPPRDTDSKHADASAGAEVPRGPSRDPKRVRQALDLTAAEPADGRARLGLRVAVVEQGPDQPWLVAVANRGTRPTSVVFDLRTLTLEVTPKAPEPDPDVKKRARVKPPKPVLCALPRDVVPKTEQRDFQTELAPGEALIDSFDPRLYCMPKDGVSPLAAGASVVASLGWAEKTKNVWRKGKQERVVLEQVPPFVARLRMATPTMPKPGSAPAQELAATSTAATEGGAPISDAFAIKQLVAPAFSLGEDYASDPAEPEPDEPLALVATGSDATTEREATVTVSLLNRSSDAYDVHFRREFVSFEVSGPSGFVSCDAGPDDRAPDRALLSRLRPGRKLAAKSRLIELCPAGALRSPGLYLVHARFDATPGRGSASEARPFWGRVVSRKPATIRVRKGWGELSGQHAPLRVSVGSAAPE